MRCISVCQQRGQVEDDTALQALQPNVTESITPLSDCFKAKNLAALLLLDLT